MILFVFGEFFPNALAPRTVPSVFCIFIFNSPETFVLLSHLKHEVIRMIVKHDIYC